MILRRLLTIPELDEDSVFLWGARQTGKSTLIKMLYPNIKYYDLLLPDVYSRMQRRPELLIEELEQYTADDLVVIDEVQMLPSLLNAVQWLIVNRGVRFLLCGSSARKLRRLGSNMLGGRAATRRLFPLVSAEIPDFDLIRAVNHGMLPRHYLANDPWYRLEGYIGNYLQQEIEAEALTRNLGSFTRFLEVAALSSGEMLNYNNIASECGMSSVTVKGYFNILQETMIGYMLPAFSRVKKRRLIKAPKFFFFDVGIVNYLCNRRHMEPGSTDFGHALEHLVVQELVAYLSYTRQRKQLSYWRTASGHEVDLVYGDAEVAIEIKSSQEVQTRHLKGLKAFAEEHLSSRRIIVSLDTARRTMGDIEVWPVAEFFGALWRGEILR
jgi:predicted AAA+ superfamily ATPase